MSSYDGTGKVTKEVIKWLIGLTDGTLDPVRVSKYKDCLNDGLCGMLMDYFDIDIRLLLKNGLDYSSFEYYSGDRAYPISHPDKTPSSAYIDGLIFENLWYYDTEYGRRRKAFALWCSVEFRRFL